MAAKTDITNARLYEAINSTRLELKADIRDLRNLYDNLEQRQNQMKTNQATLKTKFVILWSMVGMVSTSVVTAAAYRLIVRHP